MHSRPFDASISGASWLQADLARRLITRIWKVVLAALLFSLVLIDVAEQAWVQLHRMLSLGEEYTGMVKLTMTLTGFAAFLWALMRSHLRHIAVHWRHLLGHSRSLRARA